MILIVQSVKIPESRVETPRDHFLIFTDPPFMLIKFFLTVSATSAYIW